jgi:hypothetical protein
MDNLELVCRTALKDFFILLKKNEEYLKIRQKSVMNPDPETDRTIELLEPAFESDFENFNKSNQQLIDYLKTVPEKIVSFTIRREPDLEATYSIELDSEDKLVIRNLS